MEEKWWVIILLVAIMLTALIASQLESREVLLSASLSCEENDPITGHGTGHNEREWVCGLISDDTYPDDEDDIPPGYEPPEVNVCLEFCAEKYDIFSPGDGQNALAEAKTECNAELAAKDNKECPQNCPIKSKIPPCEPEDWLPGRPSPDCGATTDIVYDEALGENVRRCRVICNAKAKGEYTPTCSGALTSPQDGRPSSIDGTPQPQR